MQGVALQAELRVVLGIVLRLEELLPHPGDLALDALFHRDVEPGDALVRPPADRVAPGARRADDAVRLVDRPSTCPSTPRSASRTRSTTAAFAALEPAATFRSTGSTNDLVLE